jgi:N-acetylmuramoyl-L-alanine amidase
MLQLLIYLVLGLGAQLAVTGAAWAQATSTMPPATPSSGWAATVAPPPLAASPEPSAAHETQVAAVGVDMRVVGRRTLFIVSFTRKINVHTYTLDQPYRVIIDAGSVQFRFPSGMDRVGRGAVAAFRYGLLAPGQSRIVVDTTGPVAAPETTWRETGKDGLQSLVIELEPVDPSAFKRSALPRTASASPPETAEVMKRPQAGSRRVIVIDPGHGGIDPGALGLDDSQIVEKDIVLAVSRKLEQVLSSNKRYDVVMTRSGDVFVPLDQRVRISVQHHADLFISIHADSVGSSEYAGHVRGATIYTMSENASDERSRRLAEKENASDLLAGFDVSSSEGDDHVRNILLDLMKRESANFSVDFRRILVKRLKQQVMLAREPQRSAAFRVLRQTHAPSVLIELGYMSHAEDVRLLKSDAWQRRVAGAIASAVDDYFGRGTPRYR